jgi:WD40 repeat protein
LTDLLSSSNDLSLRIFNLSRNDPILTFEKAHSDYIKTAKYLDENTIISGGFDKYIKIWDIRSVNFF